MSLLGAPEVLCLWDASGLSAVCLLPDILMPLKDETLAFIPLGTCSSNPFFTSLRVNDTFCFENYFKCLKHSFSIP